MDVSYCPVVLGFPCLSPEVWAAWAQAVMSAAAIWAAARLASEQDRRARKRRLDSIMHLFMLAEEKASSAVEETTRFMGVLPRGRSQGFSAVAEAFASVPLHDLPDASLLPHISSARDACKELAKLYDDFLGASLRNNPDRLYLIEQCRDTLTHCADEAMHSANEAVVPMKPHWYLRRWWNRVFDRKKRKNPQGHV